MSELGQAARSIRKSKGFGSVQRLKQLTTAQFKEVMGTINGSLVSDIRRMLISNYYSRGVQTHSKTMIEAIQNAVFDISAYRIKVSMPSGIVYPIGHRGGGTHSNCYAATAKLGIFKLTPAQETEIFNKKAALLSEALRKYGLEAR